MGSLVREDMGLYKSPFVHSDWAKLGSDVDILIEMESHESPIPNNWKYINKSTSNSCDIFHLQQLELNDKFGFKKEFPHINFIHHLIDAFVFIPSKGNLEQKNAFLKKFKAHLFYSDNDKEPLDIKFDLIEDIDDPWLDAQAEDIEDPWLTSQAYDIEDPCLDAQADDIEDPWLDAQAEDIEDPWLDAQTQNSENQSLDLKSNDIANSTGAKNLAEIKIIIEQFYKINIKEISRIKAATENELYYLSDNNRSYVLKCYKVSGNYKSSQLLQHAKYETDLIDALSQCKANTPALIRSKDNYGVINIGDTPAILYTYALGRIFKTPDPAYPIAEATQALAIFHTEQMLKPLNLNQRFKFYDVYKIWHPEFYRFMKESAADEELSLAFTELKTIYINLHQFHNKIESNKQIPYLHNHGDVTPRNFVISQNKASLIDFQNSFYGPRLFDVIDGAYEFSFGGKPPAKNDFSRFDQFIKSYKINSLLLESELNVLDDMIKVVGIIKFIKETRMIKSSTNKNNLRRLRALSISEFLIERYLINT